MKYCEKCFCELYTEKIKDLNPEMLVKKICSYLNLSVGWVISNSRKREYCEARHIICDMLYHDLQLTQIEVGKLLGGRDHTTVINSLSKIEQWCFDTDFRSHYIKLHKAIYGHTMFFRYDDNFYKKNKITNKKVRFYLDRI
jgi:chromosomal replication initiation ATPase DnaA